MSSSTLTLPSQREQHWQPRQQQPTPLRPTAPRSPWARTRHDLVIRLSCPTSSPSPSPSGSPSWAATCHWFHPGDHRGHHDGARRLGSWEPRWLTPSMSHLLGTGQAAGRRERPGGPAVGRPVRSRPTTSWPLWRPSSPPGCHRRSTEAGWPRRRRPEGTPCRTSSSWAWAPAHTTQLRRHPMDGSHRGLPVLRAGPPSTPLSLCAAPSTSPRPCTPSASTPS